ncbi:PD-(D/E)XK nuclease family protein [Mycoplasmatota bacterium]|nr:PD-(D/E)XK nuclease family protein [Mycoplasmatota bacterium]
MSKSDKKTLVFTESFAKAILLNKQYHKKVLSNNKYINGLLPLTKVKNNYPFFIYNQYSIEPDLSKKILPYFDYIDLHLDYEDEKLSYIKKIKKDLIHYKLLDEFDITQYDSVVQLDGAYIPKFIHTYESSINISTIKKDIPLYRTKNKEEQVYSVFEKVVELLNQGVDIAHIKIVNTQTDDDFQLKKLFNDAQIPLVSLKKESIKSFPIYKEIKKYIKSGSLEDARTFIDENKDHYSQIFGEIINVFNKYSDALIKANLNVFMSELDQITVKPIRKKNAIEIISIDQIKDLSHYYLMMNYIDEYFPKKDIDNDYLTNKQKELIDFPTSEDMNQYRLNLYAHLFDGLENLYLFYPEFLIDHTRLSYLSLNRDYQVIDYNYKVKDQSYIKTDDFLRYAIKKNLYDQFHEISEDLDILRNTFEEGFSKYNPQFTGIKKDDLDELLQRKYTLTGAKIETLKLCPFQYFLQYLLNMGDYADNHYVYFGNKIHKALEELIKDPNYDYKKMILQSHDFPMEIMYKKSLFDQILIENIEHVYAIINDFYMNSQYKEVITEKKLSFKIKPTDRFLINGIIDKVMIDSENHYYVIIDYKFSKKTFSVEEFNKELKLQLPFYMYMFEKHFQVKPSGLFFRKTGYDREKENTGMDNLLNGVFLNDREQMERLDPSGKHITGLRYTKDGLYKSNRALTEEDFKSMSKTLESYIYKAAKKIETGDFEIKPIIGEEKNNHSISCLYCDFAHICYSKDKYVKAGDHREIY